jgi:hypothetical protein
MKSLTSLINTYFDPGASSVYATYENLHRSNTIILRLPENVYIAGEYLTNVLEQDYPLGTVDSFNTQTHIDANGTMQTIYMFRFKWMLFGSTTVNDLFEALITFGYRDIHLCIDTMIVPIRIFYDARIEKRMRFNKKTSTLSQIIDQTHQNDQPFDNRLDLIKKEIDTNHKAFEEITQADITNLYDENRKLTKKMEDLEKLVLPLTEKLNESNSKIIELTKKLDLIKESVKWDSKFIHNKIDTMKRDIASDVYERVSESSSRRRR